VAHRGGQISLTWDVVGKKRKRETKCRGAFSTRTSPTKQPGIVRRGQKRDRGGSTICEGKEKGPFAREGGNSSGVKDRRTLRSAQRVCPLMMDMEALASVAPSMGVEGEEQWEDS